MALLAVVVIVAVAQLLGAVAERIGQPRVMGAILGGILLGPSPLGALAPRWCEGLFQPQVRDQINLLAQLGLVLFMFLVGLEINPQLIRQRLALASRICLDGVVLPLLLGVGLAALLERWQPVLIQGNHTPEGALFLGVAMAITAFPVWVRILTERQLLCLRHRGPRGRWHQRALGWNTSQRIGSRRSWEKESRLGERHSRLR